MAECSGELVVQVAYIVPTDITRYFRPYSAKENYHLHFSNTDLAVPFASDIIWDTVEPPDESCPAAKDLMCLCLCQPSETMSGRDCLVLIPSKEVSGKFERMGVVFAPKDVDLFNIAKEALFDIL
jgi:hypothetical protein